MLNYLKNLFTKIQNYVNPQPPEILTLDDCVKWIEDHVCVDTKTAIAKGEIHDLFLGMFVRNNLGLWHGSPIARWFLTTWRIWHADDMSGIIFDYFNNRSLNISREVRKYHDYWVALGLDIDEECKKTLDRWNKYEVY